MNKVKQRTACCFISVSVMIWLCDFFARVNDDKDQNQQRECRKYRYALNQPFYLTWKSEIRLMILHPE